MNFRGKKSFSRLRQQKFPKPDQCPGERGGGKGGKRFENVDRRQSLQQSQPARKAAGKCVDPAGRVYVSRPSARSDGPTRERRLPTVV